jgi:hypothetical protein
MSNAAIVGGIDPEVARREVDGGCQDFLNARFRARLLSVGSFLLGKPNHLASLSDRADEIKSSSQTYAGTHTIEIARIAGSESRSADFDRRFMPKRLFLLHRWLRVNRAYYAGLQLPAIKVFELDGSYYVRDGNHRVSVAKYHGVRYIDAEIVRIAS